jgi:RTX calcium-binding nonapeptide repeat (4 copies)
MIPSIRLAIAVLAALVLPVEAASAAQLSFDGRLVYTAAPGERNLAEFFTLDDMFGPPQVRVYDQVPIAMTPDTAGAGCVRESANVILCDPHPVVASLGDMDDEGTGSAGRDVIEGGSGNDALWGGPGDDLISGGEGDDELEAQRNFGMGPREETLGADALSGGPGTDALGYQSRLDPLTVTLDDQPNDGAPGEGDNVASDVERVTGGHGADTLVGNGAANHLDGFGGPDSLAGGDGNDTLGGDAGNDEVRGEAGDDVVAGSSGSDVIDGGPGADQFYGDESTCTIFECSGGDDELRARDGQVDTLRCGVGTDRAVVDRGDVVHEDLRESCESVDRPGGASQQPSSRPPSVRVPARARFAAFRRGIVVEVTCPSACSAAARLFADRKVARRYRLGAGRTRIAKGGRRLAAAGSARVRLRATRAAKRRLARARRFRAALVVTVRTADGTAWRKQVRLEVRR